MNRRAFLQSLGEWSALAALPAKLPSGENAWQASLEIDSRTAGATLPLNFTGLSYERAQLGNPSFFSAANSQLIQLFRSLGERGVLRLGGGTSEFTEWSTRDLIGPPPFDLFDWNDVRKETTVTITPGAIRNLRGFLNATGWQLLYGLRAARGTPEEAAAEAAFVEETIGPRLLGFQIGNEPDHWHKEYRPESWGFEDYYELWRRFQAAIMKRTPQARFAGPDVASYMDWVKQFADQVRNEIVLLTWHYYDEGPATSPEATLDRLLSPNPVLVKDLNEAAGAYRLAHLPYRMSEGNSCSSGGKLGVSDTLGSSLWAADMMLQFAQAGCAGVNLHGGANGPYTPIAGSRKVGFIRRPVFYGMMFAGLFTGSTMVKSVLTTPSDRLTAHAARKDSTLQVAVINKGMRPAEVLLENWSSRKVKNAWILSGPSLSSKQDVMLRPLALSPRKSNVLSVPAQSAVLWHVESDSK